MEEERKTKIFGKPTEEETTPRWPRTSDGLIDLDKVDLIPGEQAAKLLGITPRQIASMVDAGRLLGFRTNSNSRIRVTKDSIRLFLERESGVR